jgi:isoprenylcysteine carboxyl methyltransferase (ICMT) family protein YpbQ
MSFTFIYIIFLVIALIYQLLEESKSKRIDKQTGKIFYKWSYALMAVIHILLLVFSVCEYFILDRKVNWFISAVGLLLFIAGSLGRSWAINSLAECWSVHIEIFDSHKLVKSGAYKYMRHPNYLSVSLRGIGYTLIPNSYYSLLFCLVVYIPLIFWRMILEEKVLINKFGNQYLSYKAERWTVFPFKKLWRTKNI